MRRRRACADAAGSTPCHSHCFVGDHVPGTLSPWSALHETDHRLTRKGLRRCLLCVSSRHPWEACCVQALLRAWLWTLDIVTRLAQQ